MATRMVWHYLCNRCLPAHKTIAVSHPICGKPISLTVGVELYVCVVRFFAVFLAFQVSPVIPVKERIVLCFGYDNIHAVSHEYCVTVYC